MEDIIEKAREVLELAQSDNMDNLTLEELKQLKGEVTLCMEEVEKLAKKLENKND